MMIKWTEYDNISIKNHGKTAMIQVIQSLEKGGWQTENCAWRTADRGNVCGRMQSREQAQRAADEQADSLRSSADR